MLLSKNFLFIILLLPIFQSYSQASFQDKDVGNYEFSMIQLSLVNAFYELNHQKLFWFNPGESSRQLRQELKNNIEMANQKGLDKNRYHYEELSGNIEKVFAEKDSLEAMLYDRIFTDAAITYSKDLQGFNIPKWIYYDEISGKYEKSANNNLLVKLTGIKIGKQLTEYYHSLEPNQYEYSVLKDELVKQINSQNRYKILQLTTSMNLYRWIHHFNLDKFIIVNVGSATLRYYEQDSLMIRMKVVVGKPSTKTPRFAAYCNQVILYPYWNVPTSIALNELLPKIKRNPHHLDDLNMQLIDSKGRVVDPYSLNWKGVGKGNFPFRIRQSTGCDNSLGVIKFNLTSPFSVYLHDTNNKSVFLSSSRYFSHGCIRLERPIELGNLLLNNRINQKFLQSCLKGQQPVMMDLQPVPVFVVYMTVEMDTNGMIQYHKDIYGLLK